MLKNNKLNSQFVDSHYNSQIRILIATGIFPPDIGGPATQIDAFCKELLKDGFKVTVLTFGAKTDFQYSYRVVRVSFKFLKPIRSIIYFLRLFYLALNNDLIYATDLYTAGFSSFLVKKILGKKMVVRFAGDSAWELAQSKYGIRDDIVLFQKSKYDLLIEFKKFVRKLILVNADGIIAVSNFMKELAVLIGAREEKIRVVYNSVDFEKEISTILKTPATSATVKTIITAGRLVPWKNIDVFLYILLDLVKKYGQINFLIIGAGPEEGRLKNLTKELKLENYIKFLGKIPQKEMISRLSSADVFVLNTNYEGLSHVLLEALAAGAPVITTRVGGNPEVIQSGQNGLLVDYDNKDQWLEAICKILDNPDLAERFIEMGELSLRRFNWDNLVRDIIAFFKDILS